MIRVRVSKGVGWWGRWIRELAGFWLYGFGKYGSNLSFGKEI